MQSMTDEGTSECKRQLADQHRTLKATNRGRARGHNARGLQDTEPPRLPLFRGLLLLTTGAPRDSNLRSALAHVRDSATHHSMRAATSKIAKTLHAIKPEKALLHNVIYGLPRFASNKLLVLW